MNSSGACWTHSMFKFSLGVSWRLPAYQLDRCFFCGRDFAIVNQHAKNHLRFEIVTVFKCLRPCQGWVYLWVIPVSVMWEVAHVYNNHSTVMSHNQSYWPKAEEGWSPTCSFNHPVETCVCTCKTRNPIKSSRLPKWVFSENSGTPKIIRFNKVFHYKPSILGIPLFLETPKYQWFGHLGPLGSWLFCTKKK